MILGTDSAILERQKTIAGRARAVISEEMVQAKGSTGFADPVLVSFYFVAASRAISVAVCCLI
jgi:hypothetical protein